MRRPASAPAVELTQRLREGTHPLHRAAERAGVMRALLAGALDREHYVHLLRNLHALYDALEAELERDQRRRPTCALQLAVMYRTPALAADLDSLGPPGWSALPLAATTVAYVQRIHSIGSAQPRLLAAHAYVRYLGDLSGGQVLRDVVRRSYGLGSGSGTRFYEFDGDVAAMRQQLRRALDGLVLSPPHSHAVVAEARAAFELHIQLFEELHAPAT